MNWQNLIQEHSKWEDRNFSDSSSVEYSVMGVIEEMGELAHAHLKALQKIRGEEHEKEMLDAIGDMTIYLLGVMKGVGEPRGAYQKTNSVDQALFSLSHAVGQLAGCFEKNHISKDFKPTTHTVGRIVWYLIEYCGHMEWKYDTVVADTWENVKRRDWITYPNNGLTA